MPVELTRPDNIVLLNAAQLADQDVSRVAAAIQQQVLQHVFKVWNVFASIIARRSGESIPPNSWFIYLKRDMDPRLGGVHYYTPGGAPYAYVGATSKEWPLAASHEVIEMLTDPKTDTFRRAPDPNGDVGLVDYLLEVCDPCQHSSCAYWMDEVPVSDFYGPNYFDPVNEESRLSMNNKIRHPRQILPGGYVSFRDARGEMYIATPTASGRADYRLITGFNQLPGDSVREQVDFVTASMSGLGYAANLKKMPRRPRDLRKSERPVPFDSKAAEREEAKHERHFRELCEKVKKYDAENARATAVRGTARRR